jgi:hypothetical protein
VHELALKLPAPLELKPTVPVGALAVPASVSVTNAVHDDARPTATVVGEHVTPVDVERAANTPTMSKPKLRIPPSWLESPLYWARIVCDPDPTALGVQLSEHVAVPGLVRLSVQPPRPKKPAPSALNPTLPVGVIAEPGEVSVTVAVHSVARPTATGLGEQLKLVDADRADTPTLWLPLLALWCASPP